MVIVLWLLGIQDTDEGPSGERGSPWLHWSNKFSKPCKRLGKTLYGTVLWWWPHTIHSRYEIHLCKYLSFSINKSLFMFNFIWSQIWIEKYFFPEIVPLEFHSVQVWEFWVFKFHPAGWYFLLCAFKVQLLYTSHEKSPWMPRSPKVLKNVYGV